MDGRREDLQRLHRPGKPWQSGTNESFNGTLRDECLGFEWFRSRPEAVVVIEAWRRHYNEVRPATLLAWLLDAERVQTESMPVAFDDGGAMRLRANVRRAPGSTRHVTHGRESEEIASNIAWVEIECDDGTFFLLYFSATGECLADTWHPSLEEAKHQAHVEFEIEDSDWKERA